MNNKGLEIATPRGGTRLAICSVYGTCVDDLYQKAKAMLTVLHIMKT